MNPIIFYFFKQLGSTNEWALNAQRDMPFCCVTEEQSSGRGRRLNQWQSCRGDLLLSYATEMRSVPNHLGVMLAVHLADFFNDHGVYIKVKWPNDLILFSQAEQPIKGELSPSKVGGVLIETQVSADKSKVVFGVGLNLSSLHQSNASISIQGLSAQEVLMEVSRIIANLSVDETIKIDMMLWQRYDCLLNKHIDFEVSQSLDGIDQVVALSKNEGVNHEPLCRYRLQAIGINQQGELLVYDEKSQSTLSLSNAFNIRLC